MPLENPAAIRAVNRNLPFAMGTQTQASMFLHQLGRGTRVTPGAPCGIVSAVHAGYCAGMFHEEYRWHFTDSAEVAGSRRNVRRLREAKDGLLPLRVNLIRNCPHISQKRAEIHRAQVGLQSVEYAHLQDTRLLDIHRNRIALRLSNPAVLDRAFRWLLRPKRTRRTQPRN
jgi:hypothetical protein